ncbi:MAG: D-glycero-beta-D-manno-heptose 1-phosphate adenylyltransferase [Ignavibacteriales bacterium CG12_big_fil_rev_8_21_14_0_65_30_8]|nr:MAG: D-glycero-beta-D-manno-heptose 1-phosphate adenylyltransferase [Ignavibacteriales bacterium CG12_big_fil_rev_8_21_14_0_65_30_8]
MEMTNNIKTLNKFLPIREELKKTNKKVVFTNGCFDIIHAGHIDYLNKAKNLGDILLVGVNSDRSVNNIKGENRPIIPEDERALIISNLKPVDYVILFDEDTPEKLIEGIIPDILVKGADWDLEKIVGKDIVIKNGGQVKSIEFVINQSTSKIVDSILKRYNK